MLFNGAQTISYVNIENVRINAAKIVNKNITLKNMSSPIIMLPAWLWSPSATYFPVRLFWDFHRLRKTISLIPLVFFWDLLRDVKIPLWKQFLNLENVLNHITIGDVDVIKIFIKTRNNCVRFTSKVQFFFDKTKTKKKSNEKSNMDCKK